MASTGWMCPRSALASPGRHRPELHQNGIPHFLFYLAGGQLGRAVPGSRGTSPGEPAGAVGALRKAPPRSGPSDANPRRGKRVTLNTVTRGIIYTINAILSGERDPHRPPAPLIRLHLSLSSSALSSVLAVRYERDVTLTLYTHELDCMFRHLSICDYPLR